MRLARSGTPSAYEATIAPVQYPASRSKRKPQTGHASWVEKAERHLGCGTVTNVVYLARHRWTAVGVDFAGPAIARARRRARAARREVRLPRRECDAARLP